MSLLEEAIESFHRQDYAGEKELVVLNDLEDQHLEYDHPEVRIINHKVRWPTMGEKRHETVVHARYDILCCWDDDDIHLPHRLTRCVRGLEHTGYKAFREQPFVWCRMDQDHFEVKWAALQGAIVYTRQAYNAAGGYKPINCGQDSRLVDDLRDAGCLGQYKQGPPAYVYRWGTGTYHLSGWGPDHKNQGTPGYIQVTDRVNEKMKRHMEPKGLVMLRPRWRLDYMERCNDLTSPSASTGP